MKKRRGLISNEFRERQEQSEKSSLKLGFI